MKANSVDQGLPCFLRPVCSNTKSKYCSNYSGNSRHTVNPLYTDTQYSDKIRCIDNLTGMKPLL